MMENDAYQTHINGQQSGWSEKHYCTAIIESKITWGNKQDLIIQTLETRSTNISLSEFLNVTPFPQRQGAVFPLAFRRALLILGQDHRPKQQKRKKKDQTNVKNQWVFSKVPWLRTTFFYIFLIKTSVNGSVSKPCTPGEHQNSW
jgi:hypothetical protein